MKRSEIKRRPLSDTTIAALEPEDTQYRVQDSPGLYLRVSPKGAKAWNLRYRKPDGRWGWKTLGRYPDLPAREARRIALSPPEEDSASVTFATAAEEWYTHKETSGNSPSSLGQKRRYLDKDILPAIGEKPLTEVTRHDCAKIQAALEQRGARAMAPKMRSWLNQIFSRAIAMGLCELNPASELKALALPSTEKSYAHLLEPDLPAFLRALSDTPALLLADVATWMLLRTAARPGMVRYAEWSEIDLGNQLWTIPADKMKMRRAHDVPLSTQVCSDLERLRERTGRSRWLFPGARNNPVMSEGTINKVIRTAGYRGKLVGHGARHTASTLLNEHGWPSAHVEAQLAHKEKGVAGIYNRAAYLEPRRAMMQWYSDYLDALRDGGDLEALKARVGR